MDKKLLRGDDPDARWDRIVIALVEEGLEGRHGPTIQRMCRESRALALEGAALPEGARRDGVLEAAVARADEAASAILLSLGLEFEGDDGDDDVEEEDCLGL
jgi:hypothetical protein